MYGVSQNNELSNTIILNGLAHAEDRYIVSYITNANDYLVTANFHCAVGSDNDITVHYFY